MKRAILTLLIVWSSTLCFSQSNNITSKFDFIPGEKVIFFDDFTSENIGDFPAKWLTNGSGEIVTSREFEGRWFQITKTGYYIPEANDKFLDNFTIEFDFVILGEGNSETTAGIDLFFLSGELTNPLGGTQPGQAGMRIQPDYETTFWNNWSEAREWQGDAGQVPFMFKSKQKYHLSFWVQKQRVRMYINDQKVLDIPRGLQANYIYNIFRIENKTGEITQLISNFRIAAGLPDMRNKLIAEGKLVSYGILFDVNADKLKPESNPTIKEIAQILKDNPSVKINIIGHTDSDGNDALNLDLSKRRAASVKNELINAYSIDASRIQTDGKGEDQPLVPNESAVNKAKNRRVEFIKL
ncbi:MAG: OmpA family protein [Candidatus Kapaibacterium sp.]